MSLRERVLDAVFDGGIGKGIVVSRQEMIIHSEDVPGTYTGVFLSNSEMETGQHSPTDHFMIRLSKGIYRIHPAALLDRMRERNMLK